ncbi:low affinity iron permease family protein [Singulisphaera sp. Ch08]|uniref:Low affinity iron permease family protein n=1 Tax=Singulisphaera sp. Ch08 TaxID=3120278 RepID=A0AAU7CC05_9BACT
MVFQIQDAQNRESKARHLKLDELISGVNRNWDADLAGARGGLTSPQSRADRGPTVGGDPGRPRTIMRGSVARQPERRLLQNPAGSCRHSIIHDPGTKPMKLESLRDRLMEQLRDLYDV